MKSGQSLLNYQPGIAGHGAGVEHDAEGGRVLPELFPRPPVAPLLGPVCVVSPAELAAVLRTRAETKVHGVLLALAWNEGSMIRTPFNSYSGFLGSKVLCALF